MLLPQTCEESGCVQPRPTPTHPHAAVGHLGPPQPTPADPAGLAVVGDAGQWRSGAGVARRGVAVSGGAERPNAVVAATSGAGLVGLGGLHGSEPDSSAGYAGFRSGGGAGGGGAADEPVAERAAGGGGGV